MKFNQKMAQASNKENVSANANPGIHEGWVLESIQHEVTERNQIEIARFNFAEATTGKLVHTHVEKAPDATAGQDKLENQGTRVIHIMKKAFGNDKEQEIIEASGNTFQQTIEGLSGLVEKYKKDGEEKVMKAKILGSITPNGRARAAFPGYIPFLENDESKAPLQIQDRELREIRQYEAHMQAGSDDTDSAAAPSQNDGQESPF